MAADEKPAWACARWGLLEADGSGDPTGCEFHEWMRCPACTTGYERMMAECETRTHCRQCGVERGTDFSGFCHDCVLLNAGMGQPHEWDDLGPIGTAPGDRK